MSLFLTRLAHWPLAVAVRSRTALDLNENHVALNRLKLAAARHLPDHATFFRFFGEADSRDNVRAYDDHLRDRLDATTRAYWDRRDLAGRRLQQAGHEAERHWEQTRAQAAQGLEHRLTRVEQDHREIVATARLTVLRRQDRLDFLMLSCREAGVRHAQSALNTLEQPWRQIRELGAQRLRTAATQCEQLIQVIIALGPEKTLRRGYGVLRTGGRVITTRSAIAPGDEFSVEMQDGVMTARRLT